MEAAKLDSIRPLPEDPTREGGGASAAVCRTRHALQIRRLKNLETAQWQYLCIPGKIDRIVQVADKVAERKCGFAASLR